LEFFSTSTGASKKQRVALSLNYPGTWFEDDTTTAAAWSMKLCK